MLMRISIISALTLLAQCGLREASAHDDGVGQSQLVPYRDNSIVTGRLDASPECSSTLDRRNPEVWLSIGQILLYQVEVPVNGSYEFHVVPGKYDLLATNSKGCLAQAQLTTSPKLVSEINLRLSPARAPAAVGK